MQNAKQAKIKLVKTMLNHMYLKEDEYNKTHIIRTITI